uniref:Uncharacterized protein n=1 Tax=Arundo donax TaxID=35708 RepID=A0A0A8YVH6_ARUDO
MHKSMQKFLFAHTGNITEANFSIEQPLRLEKIHQMMPWQQPTLNAIQYQCWL